MKKNENKKLLKRKERGITLIALVITIIVLIILAGVTINMLFGENGLLNRATKTAEEYSKSEAKEKVDLLLSEYVMDRENDENNNFANFLRKNLQVGVAENDDNTYSFMLGEWQFITDENKVISIEKFKLDVDKTYPNVASMEADTGLTEGNLVQTEGYWNKQYGGSAYYDIVSSTSLTVDEGKCLQLDNGLYAELHAINDTVTVNQFGAYGDGEHDDAEAINLALNSEYHNVMFENCRYKFGNVINITKSNIYVIGNNATVFWNEEITAPWEQFCISGTIEKNISNIQISHLNFENGNISIVDYPGESMQVRGSYCDNININNCKFYIGEIPDNNRQITNLWFHTKWENIVIENNTFINLTNSGVGGNIWLSSGNDIEGYTSKNAIVKNNYIEKSCHDESVAVFGVGTVEKVSINNNVIYTHEDKVQNPSDFNFAFGEENAGIVKDIEFSNNQITTEGKLCFAVCDGIVGSENILIHDNIINWTCIGDTDSSYKFIDNKVTKKIKIYNNKINYEIKENKNGYLKEFIDINEEYYQNEISINGRLYNLHSFNNEEDNTTKCYNNTININNEIEYLYGGYYFCNNTVNINSNIKSNRGVQASLFSYISGTSLLYDVIIDNNNIYMNCSDTWNDWYLSFLSLTDSRINNHNIMITNNNLNIENQKNIQNILNYTYSNEESSQKIQFKNNNLGSIFKRIVFYNNLTTHRLIIDNQEVTSTSILE